MLFLAESCPPQLARFPFFRYLGGRKTIGMKQIFAFLLLAVALPLQAQVVDVRPAQNPDGKLFTQEVRIREVKSL